MDRFIEIPMSMLPSCSTIGWLCARIRTCFLPDRFPASRETWNRSPQDSLTNYESGLRQLADCLKNQPDGTLELEQVDHLLIRAYLGEFYARQGQNSSAARHLSVIRSLYKCLAREGVVTVNPAKLVTSPKILKKLPDIPTADELEKFFNALPEDNETRPVR